MNFFSKTISALLFACTCRTVAMITAPVTTPDVAPAADSCVVDIEALSAQAAASGVIASDDTKFIMCDADGKAFVDTSKIPAAVEAFKKRVNAPWSRERRKYVAIKVTELTLMAIAASGVGYITGADFVTLVFGAIAGISKAYLLRDAPVWVRLSLGASLGFLDGLVDKIGGPQYYYGFDAVDETYFLVTTIFDWLLRVTGLWSSEGEMYLRLDQELRTGSLDVEFGRLSDEIRRTRSFNTPFMTPASISTMTLG